MIVPTIYGILLFLPCLSTLTNSKKKYPNIEDVVSFSKRPHTNFISRLVEDIKSFIDIDKFRTNEKIFRKQIRGNLEDTVLLEGKPIESRRVRVFQDMDGEKIKKYEQAISLQFRTKVADSMLQLIYMARHFLKIFERTQYVDKNSNAYRIGVIARKLAYLYKKSVRILEILNLRQKKDKWVTGNTSAPALTLHHKVAGWHVDFNYYYEVLKKLHFAIRDVEQRPRERPPLKRVPQVW